MNTARNISVQSTPPGSPELPFPGGAEYLRVDRVARLLDICKKRVYQLVQQKRLLAIKLGPRQMRISRHSLDAYLADLLEKNDEG